MENLALPAIRVNLDALAHLVLQAHVASQV